MFAPRASRRSSQPAVARRSSPSRRAFCLAALLALAGLSALAVPVAAHALAPGDLLWLDTYPLSGSGADSGAAVAVAESGTVYAAGTLVPDQGSNSDIVLVARAADGSPLWATSFDGPGHGPDTATSVAVGPGGAIYVAGQTTRAGSRDLVVLRFSPAGGLVWKRFIGGTAGPDQASALALDGSGNVLVAGWVTWRGRGTNVALAKYTPAGDKLWLRTWDGATHRTDKATDLAVDGAGNAVLVGSTALARNSQTAGLLLKYSASGDLRWARRQGGTGGDALASVALAANGAVFAGGRTRLAKTGVDALVVKYTAAGAPVWKWVATGKGDGRDAIADIAVDGAGWVHAAGSTVALGTHSDGLVMSAGPNGLSRSVKAYDGGSYLTDAFRTVACGAAGDVFVGGFITSATGVTSAVVAQYSRDLSQRPWLTTFKGTVPGSQNRAVDLALAPGGVFVAGTVVDTVTGPDLALAKLRR